MAKNPDDRYQSAREILRDLAKVRDGISVGLAWGNGTVSQSQPVALALSITSTNGVAAVSSPAPAAPGRWGRWMIAALAGAGALAAGVLVYAVLNPRREAAHAPAPTTGLPDVRSPEKLVTTRERELIALLDKRDVAPGAVVDYSIELGLLYVREGRLDEAVARFARLEKERFGPEQQFLTRKAGLTGRLGHAITTAYRETPDAAQQSNKLFVNVLMELAAKGPPKADRHERGYRALSAILLQHLDLAQAVSEALNRNALALGKSPLEPSSLERLRTPPKAEKQE
jgi:hypothetical protein